MHDRKNICVSIGIVFALVGISCMAMVKALLGSNIRSLSFIVAGLSVVLMAIGQDLRYVKAGNRDMILVFVYIITTLIMSLFSGIDIMQVEYGFIYQLVYFLQIYLLWNVRRDLSLSFVVEFGFWLTGLFCTIALVLLFRFSMGGLLFYNSYLSSSGEYIFNRSATGNLSYMTLVFSLSYKPQNKVETIFRQLFLAISILVIAFSTRRSVYAAVILTIIIKIKNDAVFIKRMDRKKFIRNIVALCIFIVAFYLAYRSSENIRITIEKVWESFISGLFTITGRESTDMAASMRATTSSAVIDQYLNHSTIIEYLFGRGYMETYVDMPFIQAFWDMGLLGGIVFFIIQFIIPIKYILKKPRTQAFTAAQYIAAFSVVNGVISSTPYGHLFNMVIVIVMSEVEDVSLSLLNEGRKV